MKNSITRDNYTRKLKIFLVKAIHFLASTVLFTIAWMLFRYRGLPKSIDVGFRYNYFVVACYGISLYLFNKTYNSYLMGYSRIRSLVFAQMLSQAFSAGIIYFIVSLAWNRMNSPLHFILLLIPQFLLDVLWSYWGTWYFFKIHPPKSTILVYRNELDRRRFGSIKGKPTERLYRITKEVMYNGKFKDLRDHLDGYEAIFVAGVNSKCRNGILKYCKEYNIPGFFLPHVGDVIMQEARHIQAFDSPVLFVERKVLAPEYAIVKRGFDFIASLLAIVLTSPVMLVTALAIRLYDGGPAIYKQVRLTKDGKEFKILKFRSMRVDAEKDGVARLSTGDQDDRITPIGKWVRKCRLDELPQLFNILKGDMSLVGPRPERPEIAEQYYRKMPDFKLRLQVKAGLTGYAQIYGKYNTEPYEKLEFDLLYIKTMGVLTDLELIFATFSILFSSESTAGIDTGAVTAMDYGEEDVISNKEREQIEV